MTSKKTCINYPSCTYTGKEQSPLRFGLSAEGYAVNSVLEGYDKHLWVVEIKNNKKVWIRKDENFKITPEEPVMHASHSSYPSHASPEHASHASNIPVAIVPNVAPAEQKSHATIPAVQPSGVEKKTTDYNLYLSYRLKQLKEEAHETDIDNKGIFNQVIQEWRVIKNKPEELNKILEEARQQQTQKPAKKTKKPIKKATAPTSVPAPVPDTTIVTTATNATTEIKATTVTPDITATNTTDQAQHNGNEKPAKTNKRTNKK